MYGGGFWLNRYYTLIDESTTNIAAWLVAIWSGTGLDVTGGFFAMNNAPKGAIYQGVPPGLEKLSFIRNTRMKGLGLCQLERALQQIGLIVNQGRNGAAIITRERSTLPTRLYPNIASPPTMPSHAGSIYNQKIAILTN